jgi:phenylacetic acid degradation operon negative regulatory protein
VGAWRKSEERLREWRGDYLVVHTGALSRRDRPQLRRRQRALDIVGFRELERDLLVRPNNVERDVEAVRARLLDVGMDDGATVFVGAAFDVSARERIDTLWDGAALNAIYARERERLEEWMGRMHLLEPEVLARESYLIGSQAIRRVVFDPWLPAPFVDVAMRHAFFETVCRFDEVGRDIWRSFTADAAQFPVSETDSITRH